MNEVALLSRQIILKSSPGGLRPSITPSARGPSLDVRIRRQQTSLTSKVGPRTERITYL